MKKAHKLRRAHDTNANNMKLFGIKLLHFVITIVLFYYFWILFRYNEYTRYGYGFRYNYYIAGGFGLCLLLLNRTYNAYLLGYSRIRTLVFSQFLAQFFSVTLMWVGVTIAWRRFYAPWVFFGMLAFQLLLDIAWSYFSTWFYFRITPTKRTVLIYRNKLDRHRFGSVKGRPAERIYKIVKEIQYDGSFKELKDQLAEYDAIFVAGINSRCRNGILKYCEEEGIPGFFLPHVGDVIMQRAVHIQSFDSPVLYVNRKVLEPEYVIIKRVFDIVMSAIGIVVLSPIMLITAVAIKAYDHGPALYKQVRLTKNGREFKILKFRSMRVDAEKDGVARLSTGENDNRITPIGRIVRKCRLDELPQLFNILIGDMSIVGPRPERPEIAEQYYKTMPDFQLRLQVQAGLTGYAQVYGKYNTDPYEKLEFDLLYIKDMSMLTDLKLMFATVGVLFSSESTTGVTGTTAMDYEEE